MTSLLDELPVKERWIDFLEYKKGKSHLPQRTIREIEDFVANGMFMTMSASISEGTYEFSIPRKRQINKAKVGKKRDVYTYRKDEMIILKMIANLLHRYDWMFSPNLYSFRRDQGVKKAVYDLLRVKDLDTMYGYKVDIRNYFNSVDAERLLKRLHAELEDERLYDLFEKILANPSVMSNDGIVTERKGIMAGLPTAAFLANYYLKDMDRHFFEKDVIYFRYADDIIVFSDSPEELESHKDTIRSFLGRHGLDVNTDKEFHYGPGDSIEFLGFSFRDGTVDLGENTKRKMKAKIKRASRSIGRWARKKGISGDPVIKVMIKKFDRKFFGSGDSELSWRYWFFPTINTDAGLKEIDAYMQDRLRYLVTGRYSGRNHIEVPYERLKECGYRSLVHEFHSER